MSAHPGPTPELTLAFLKQHSGLPGPRANLGLLATFLEGCDEALVQACLAELTTATGNSPEEFVGMCGVVGYALEAGADPQRLAAHLETFAVHPSWRIREAVAIAIQELPLATLRQRVDLVGRLNPRDPLVLRAGVAGLCEPKNLQGQAGLDGVFDFLGLATRFLAPSTRLSAGEVALKKALGYGWSVALVADFDTGRPRFEDLLTLGGSTVEGIVAENLTKKRLQKLQPSWVEQLQGRLKADGPRA